MTRWRVCLAAAGLASILGVPLGAYSVLSHESAVDAAWERDLKPLLAARYPTASAEALEEARSYAYGGSVIQDLGYYPFGSKFFSNLLHYVRSGDFVQALLADAGDVNELAFALGALAHYENDNAGHPHAVNRAVPKTFPKLRDKFGDSITYVEAPKQHVIVEFSYDVAQAARGTYSFTQYRSLIGFKVSVPLLERAFRETYALEMRDVFADQDRAISTYRYSVSQLIPALTKAAWRDKRDEILQATPAAQRESVEFTFARADFEREFGTNYEKPGRLARFAGWVYRIVPKVGPLKPLAFKVPTPETDQLFAESLALAHDRFRARLRDVRAGRLSLPNTDFDTGQPSRHAEYALADDTYAELVDKLSGERLSQASPALRRDLETFYGGAIPDPHARERCATARRDLRMSKNAATSCE